MIEAYGFQWISNVRESRFPELKPFLHRYPIQLHSAVGHDELHRPFLYKFSDKILVKMPNALGEQ
jgi:hypothetical protein